MVKVSTEQELERVVSLVQCAGFTGDIECGGDIAKSVGSFFSTYQRSNELGWVATVGGVLAVVGGIIFTAGAATVAVAGLAAAGVGAKSDYDLKATSRLELGDLCHPLATKGYRMKSNRPSRVLLSCG